jgi:acetolactate synthase I/II/III large subunit
MSEHASGHLAVGALKRAGVDHLFTLSGGHIFPLYEGCRDHDVRIVDTRHEQAAAFAAEGLGKLTRRPGVAALTAGPGVTNGVSAVASARFGGSPMLVIGGRAPHGTWGRGGLQEIDHVAFMAPLTKHAVTATEPADVPGAVIEALRSAATPGRGPAFVDIPMDTIFTPGDEGTLPTWSEPEAPEVDTEAVRRAAERLAGARRPVVVAGTDVWLSGAVEGLRALVETVRAPTITNGMGRGTLPADHELAFSWARKAAFTDADLVVVIGTPLDFRLGFGAFPGGAPVIHVVDTPAQIAEHAGPVEAVAGHLPEVLQSLAEGAGGPTGELAEARGDWVGSLREVETAARAGQEDLLGSDAAPIHPARVYGELRQVLDRDAVVIGDGGDFVSYAGKYIDAYTPGCWMDPGPYGCLGTGMGYSIAARLAHPDRQVVTLLGDGAAGFGLMDVETLVRHQLPVVMVMGNNGIWALEKYPMQQVYDGWDVAADLQPGLAYDQVASALGGAGETVTEPGELAGAFKRAFDAGVPYLVNVLTDPDVAYPRSTALA